MTELVTIEYKDNGVAHVILNRPDKYNSLNSAMFNAISAAGETLKGNKEIRSVVLSGEGKGFCAGLDFMSMAGETGGPAGPNGDRFVPQGQDIANYYQKPGFVWTEVPVPVIAALHGACFGGGFQIAMGADIRVARPDAKLSIMEIKWGLIPDMSACATLPSICSLAVAKDLTYTGRIVEAEEAKSLGLVNSVHEDHLSAAFEVADLIASKSPDAIRAGKALLEKTWTLDPKESMVFEGEYQQALIGKPNQTEAVVANMQKREPKFKPAE